MGRKSKWYFIIKFSLLLSIIFCWREIRPDAGKTTENKFVASFLSIDYSEKRIQTKLLCCSFNKHSVLKVTSKIQTYIFTVPSPCNRRTIVGIESVQHSPYQSM